MRSLAQREGKANLRNVRTGKKWALSGILAAAFASPALAFTAPLQQLPSDVFQIAASAVLLVTAALLITVLIQHLGIRRMRTKAAGTEQILDQRTEQLDSLSSGVVFLTDTGGIAFANRSAAYLLGCKAEALYGRQLIDLLPEQHHSEIEQILNGTREQRLQCLLPSRNRHYLLRINPRLPDVTGYSAMVCLEDVHPYQQKLDYQTDMQQHILGLPDQAEFGLVQIQFGQQQVSVNHQFGIWLGENAASERKDEAFFDLFSETSRGDVTQAFSDMAEGQTIAVEAELISPKGSIPVMLSGSVAPHTRESDAPIGHLVVTSLAQKYDLKAQVSDVTRRLQTLSAASAEAIYFLDGDDRLVDCNRPFATLFGAEPMRVKGKHIEELACFNDELKALHRKVESMMPKRSEVTLNRSDGSEKRLHVTLQWIVIDTKRIGMVGIVRDLTEHYELKQELSEAENRLATFMDRAPMGIAVFDGNDKLTEVNQTLCKQLGLQSDELKSRSFYQLFANSEHSATAARKLHRHDALNEFAASLKDVNDKPVSTTLYASKIREIPEEYVCWVGGRAEQEYLNNRFERLIKYTSAPVALLGDDGFTQLNTAACAFFGVQEEDLLGRRPDSIELNATEQQAKALSEKLTLVREQGQVLTFDWQHHYQGQILPTEATFIPVFRDGVLQSVICIWIDLRAVEQANAARVEAVKLRQAAEQEVAEKQQLLKNNQDKLAQQSQALAQTEQNLADTAERLKSAEDNLSEKISTISDLQQAHKDISSHLASLQQDYEQNRELLARSQQANSELESQLQQSGEKVGRLEKQRNQIAEALQYSEKQHKEAQLQLDESRKETERLKQARKEQQQQVDSYASQIERLRSSISDKDQQMAAVSHQIQTLQSELQNSSQVSDSLREQLANQRKASEQAQKERRELELACRKAESELAGKARHIDHLQHEMQMLEEMSKQQKGDMEKHAKQLQDELRSKQAQLSETALTLEQLQKQAEQEKREKEAQQNTLARLQEEMAQVQKRAEQQQQQVAQADQAWKEQQQKLQAALAQKQAQLQKAEEFLNDAKQQTQAERDEKARQQALFNKLKNELEDMQAQADEQRQAMQVSDKNWQNQQQSLAQELAEKQAQLDKAQAQLDAHQKQVDAEKLARMEQQNMLSQLKSELSDVEQRAAKQQALMAGSDEQWRKHHEEIEAQKQQLQQALKQAQSQNSQMQTKLQSSMADLADAEAKVSKTQSEEQKLQQELNHAKAQAESLADKLKQQEQREAQLQSQVVEQQKALKDNESSISALKQQQATLTAQLEAVQKEYQSTKASLSQQGSSQSDLNLQLKQLEQELKESRSQLTNKEKALQSAQNQLETSKKKLANQEQVLIDAQKAELHREQKSTAVKRPEPEYAKLEMPPEPQLWFDLLPYLQQNRQVGSLGTSLTKLMTGLENAMNDTDKAVMEDDHRQILLSTRKLIKVIEPIHAEPLNDMSSRLMLDCEQNNTDNISIFWPIAKQNLQRTLRVIYSHMHE
ncbi:PAS domain S-box protein [Alteromonas aestuariivivens]|uniref:PAS domain S-box protein n=1 Tax=Alteromonas aestuariivivens TaxID=1938339 RepID=A0A3D8MAD9_9ALTE|nr:PAS domain S-box protein [Alteromonas aestuariivivens]RDV26784.1 PAS domain S-box protein [Alteromonas aestuariivivens]